MIEDFNIDNNEWDKFKHLFKRKEVSAKTILLKEGDVSKKAFLTFDFCVVNLNNIKK